MSEITWIKITTDMFEDEKLLIIESMPECDAILVMWAKLMLRAGKCNAGGWIYLAEGRPYTEEMLAAIFRRPINTVRLALSTLTNLGMIEVSDNGIFIINWEKYQNIQALGIIRERNRLRKAKQRDSQKPETVTAMSQQCHSNVTQQNKIEEIDKEKEQDKNLTGGKPPSIDPIDCCFTYSDYQNLLEVYPDKVALLVTAFKKLHSNAPDIDMQKCGGRIAGMYGKKGKDAGFILKVIWDTASHGIAGSHLDFINAVLFRHTSKPPNGRKPLDPDKYVKGKYAHMVQR